MTATMKLRTTLATHKTAVTRPSLRSPLSRSAVVIQAAKEEPIRGKTEAMTVGLCAAAYFLPQIASAAQEVFIVAEGEPLIVQAGWAALAASFTMSIAIVVWGRSGL